MLSRVFGPVLADISPVRGRVDIPLGLARWARSPRRGGREGGGARARRVTCGIFRGDIVWTHETAKLPELLSGPVFAEPPGFLGISPARRGRAKQKREKARRPPGAEVRFVLQTDCLAPPRVPQNWVLRTRG